MLEELNKTEQLSNISAFNFLPNNVKGLQSSKKRLKLFQYFKNKISSKGILFLQETHSSKVTFFLRDILSVKELINSFNQFYHFSRLKANIGKCEIAGIGSLKGFTEAVCGLKSVDLSNDTIKILGIHFSYSKKVQMQNDFISTIKKI